MEGKRMGSRRGSWDKEGDWDRGREGCVTDARMATAGIGHILSRSYTGKRPTPDDDGAGRKQRRRGRGRDRG